MLIHSWLQDRRRSYRITWTSSVFRIGRKCAVPFPSRRGRLLFYLIKSDLTGLVFIGNFDANFWCELLMNFWWTFDFWSEGINYPHTTLTCNIFIYYIQLSSSSHDHSVSMFQNRRSWISSVHQHSERTDPTWPEPTRTDSNQPEPNRTSFKTIHHTKLH